MTSSDRTIHGYDSKLCKDFPLLVHTDLQKIRLHGALILDVRLREMAKVLLLDRWLCTTGFYTPTHPPKWKLALSLFSLLLLTL